MKIALICDTNNPFWIKQYIENVLNSPRNKIYVFSYGFEDTSFFEKRGIKLLFIDGSYSKKSKPFITKVLSTIRFNVMVRRTQKNFDVVHLHYFGPVILFRCFRIWKQSRIKYITYYGSDLLRAGKLHLFVNQFFLRDATQIQLLTRNLEKAFREKYHGKYLNKCIVQDFGAMALEEIDRVRKTDVCNDFREERGISGESVAIAVGYNAGEAQQHDKIVESIAELPESILKQITLVFHFGYGECPSDYRSRIESLLKEKNISAVFIDEYLNASDIARFRCAMDMMINAQKTDALSSSLIEYLYAGKLLLNAKWLEYQELKDIYYKEFVDFIDMRKQLTGIISDKLYLSPRLSDNVNRIHDLYSWGVIADKWKRLYRTDV